MRKKPDYLGICHRDGCGEFAKWKARLILRDTPIMGRTTVWVCDAHKKDAEEFILNSDNRDRFVDLLITNKYYVNRPNAQRKVQNDAAVEFFDPFAEDVAAV